MNVLTYLPYTFPYTFEYRLIPNCTRIMALGVVHNNIVLLFGARQQAVFSVGKAVLDHV